MTLDQVENLVQRLHHREQMILDLMQKKVIAVDEVISDSFLLEHTSFKSSHSFFAQSPVFAQESLMDFLETRPGAIERLDGYIQEGSPFGSWEELLHRAIEQYILDHSWL